MIEMVYKCDLCDERTLDVSCCKVYYAAGTGKPSFVDKGSPEWSKTQNGRLVCWSCMRIIKTKSLPSQ